jgi:peroxiredoxin
MKAVWSHNVGTVRKWSVAVVFVLSALVIAAAQGTAPPAQGAGQRAGRGIQAPEYPVMPIGSAFPDFSLPGVDGKTHTLREYSGTKVLAVVFESDHCPVSINYEARIHQLYDDYRGKDVTVMAINPNNPHAVRLDELGYTDMSDSLPEMKIRAAFQGITWPFLYDGETQVLSMKFGAVATPHIFIFDRDRRLQYQGAIDDNPRIALVKVPYARDAIDALLAGRPVAVTQSRAVGCTTKWLSKETGVDSEMTKIKAAPVTVDPIDAEGLKALRANATTGKTMLVSFWATGCATCASQFVDIENTYRMYRLRPFDLVTVATDPPSKNAAVLDVLKTQYAGGPNKQFASTDVAALQAAWGAKWTPGAAFTAVIGPDGKVLYEKEGKIDIYEVRRRIQASIPDDRSYPAIQAYFQAAIARMEAKKK